MKKSMYNVPFSHDGRTYIYNTKSNALIEADENVFEMEEHQKFLFDANFIVETNCDEFNGIYKDVLFSIKNDFDEIAVTLVLTEQCNFECPYCYQKHMPNVMNINDAQEIIRNIESVIHKKKPRTLAIHYFGGEPLLNPDILFFLHDAFTKMAFAHKIHFNSFLTTNGSLLHADLVRKANFGTIQITIDGLEKNHNHFRRSHFHDFLTLMNTIDEVLPSCTSRIIIRSNICTENQGDLLALVDFFMTRYEEYRNRIAFSCNQMVKYSENDEFTMIGLNDFAQLDLLLRQRIGAYNGEYTTPTRINYNCVFTCGKAFCVGSDLKLNYCSGSGDISEKSFSVETYFSENEYHVREECKKCIIYPICLGGCSVKWDLGYKGCPVEKYNLVDRLKLFVAHQEREPV